MNFSTDRDLLAFEPSVFVDVPWLSQQRLDVSDAVVDATMVVAPADFEEAGLTTGDVLLLDELTCEVVSRDDASTLTVSLPRSRTTDPALATGLTGDGHRLRWRTFAPQAALVHDELLALLGVEPGDEDQVVSLSTAARLEAIGTLHRVFAAAASLHDDDSPMQQRAERYARLWQMSLRSASILLDVNGDGHAEVRRRFGLTQLTRV